LACSSEHFYFSKEMTEVDIAGSRGVRKFADYRISKQLAQKPLKQGDVLCFDAFGGNARKLVFVICCGGKEDVVQIKNSMLKGLKELFIFADAYNLKTVSMYPLCVSAEFNTTDFVSVFKEALSFAKEDCCLETINIMISKEHSKMVDKKVLKELSK